MSHARRLVVYAGSSWVRIILGFAVAFVLTPILVGELGVQLFGLLALVSISLAMADPVRNAVGKVLTREMAQAKAAGDDERLRDVFSNGVALASIVAVVIALLTLALTAVAPHIFEISSDQAFKLRVAILAEGLLTALAFIFSPAGNLYIATHRIVIENLLRSIRRTLDLLAAVIAFYLGFAWDPFLAYVLARVALKFIHLSYRNAWILSREPAARMSFAMVSKAHMKELAGVGAWSISGQVARIGFYLSDHILMNLFFGLAYNGIYSIINQLRAYARMFGGNISLGVDALAADLQERGEEDTGRRVLIVTMKMAMSVTLICAIFVGVFAGPFIDVWLGSRLRNDETLLSVMTYPDAVALATTFILILLPGVVLAETHTAATQNLYGMGHIKKYSPAIIAASIFKIVLATLWLLAGGGPLAIAFSTLIANIAVYGIYFPRLICRLAGLRLSDLVFGAYARPLVSAAVCVTVGLFMRSLFTEWDWPRLILSVAVTGAVYAITFPLIVANPYERRAMLKVFEGAARRVRRRKVARP